MLTKTTSRRLWPVWMMESQSARGNHHNLVTDRQNRVIGTSVWKRTNTESYLRERVYDNYSPGTLHHCPSNQLKSMLAGR